MSSYAKFVEGIHHNVICSIAKLSGCTSYLELGIEKGDTFSLMNTIVPHCIGVDIKDMRPEKFGKLYVMKTDDFFVNNKETFDIIFIDAEHKYESALKDFENSLKILNKYGIILMHDTDPIDLAHCSPGYCGDSYKIIDYIFNNHKELNIITLPITMAGLSIIMRKSDRRLFEYLK